MSRTLMPSQLPWMAYLPQKARSVWMLLPFGGTGLKRLAGSSMWAHGVQVLGPRVVVVARLSRSRGQGDRDERGDRGHQAESSQKSSHVGIPLWIVSSSGWFPGERGPGRPDPGPRVPVSSVGSGQPPEPAPFSLKM